MAGASRPGVELSDAALIVLRELERADGRAVLKAAIKELIAADVWRIDASPSKQRAHTAMLVTPGRQRPPRATPLPRVSRLIEATPHASGTMRDLRDVAKDIARRNRNIRKEIVREVLEDLAEAGLVVRERRPMLGIFPRARYVRTLDGEQRLGDEATTRVRRRPAATDPSYTGAYVGGDAADQMDEPSDVDAGLDGGSGSAFDEGLDSALDSSFESAFDSSFDSGFDAGGGGGDGGGGGNGGGGNGGGGD